jgi:hypothetical protein
VVADALQSTIGQMHEEVQHLNLAFDETIKHIRRGAEIGRHAVEQKNTLNAEFDAFLQLIEDQGLATGVTEQRFRTRECSELPERPVPQRAPEVI